MFEAMLHSVSNVLVLVIIAALGFRIAQTANVDERGRQLVSRIVNLAIPFFLFYSVTSKFSQEQLIELLKMAFLPFAVVGASFLISCLLVRFGMVRRELTGAFLACFTSSTVLFVGVPVAVALFGEVAIPYLLVYFFANCIFIWTVGLYNMQLDGVRRNGGEAPRLLSAYSLKIFLSPPLQGFLIGLAFVLLALPIPEFVTMTTKMFGQMVTPLAIIFIGMTIQKVGFDRLRHVQREVWLVLLSCFVLRPLLMYLFSLPFEMEPIMRKVFVVAAALPVTPVMAVLAKRYGADEEYASETVSVSVIGLMFAIPVLLVVINVI